MDRLHTVRDRPTSPVPGWVPRPEGRVRDHAMVIEPSAGALPIRTIDPTTGERRGRRWEPRP